MTNLVPAVRRITASLVILALPLTAAAATKRRIVQPHSPIVATLTGTVTDIVTGAPVPQAEVIVNGSDASALADSSGKFTLKIGVGRDVALSLSRSGYETLTTTVNISGDASRSFKLTPKVTTTLRTIDGKTLQLDTETINFGYQVPFVGYTKGTQMNLCTAGGKAFTPDRSEIQKITGPAQLSDATCCQSGPIPAVNVQLKAGGTTLGGFADACAGNDVDVIGREHVTNNWTYIHFSQIVEIDFP